MNDCTDINQKLGHYHLIRSLGRGNFSEVYLGEHIHLRTPVAIKRLCAPLIGEEAEDFLTRTAELSRLRHPHIVPIFDFGIKDEIAFLVMAYTPNGTLRQRHPRGTRVPFELMPDYLAQITSGLDYLHEQGLVHRDIKPHNILLGVDGKVLLSDFGTAIGSYSLYPGQVALQDFEGTVLYAAPEQLQGMPRRNSDQYALGIMVYEWICGDWPFKGTFHEIVHHHLFIEPPPLQEKGVVCPPNIARVVMRALEKNPVKRFPSVKQFADEFAWAYKVAQAKRQLPYPTPSLQKQAAPQQEMQPSLFLQNRGQESPHHSRGG
ncbi:MAG TPA: serine/threonine-protein kinase [Ktedonobacteraceae bacterium]|jgi:serine/threonine-protein kinase